MCFHYLLFSTTGHVLNFLENLPATVLSCFEMNLNQKTMISHMNLAYWFTLMYLTAQNIQNAAHFQMSMANRVYGKITQPCWGLAAISVAYSSCPETHLYI